jgi:tRNA(Ile)-lysidine synthase
MRQPAKPFSPERLLVELQELPPSSRWCVAFSGGADSTALLHSLWVLRKRLPVEFFALHVNHGLHPDAAHWQEHCRNFCGQLDISLHIARVEVPRNSSQGQEAAARKLRYQAATDLLQADDLLLTGHHADDQAETVLLNLMRGSGVDGLAGMPRVRPIGPARLARPLLGFDSSSLRDYLSGLGISWIEDSSNQDTAYDRNFVRQDLIPLLRRKWPAASRNLVLSASCCREASEFLAASNDRLLQACDSTGPVLDLDCLRSNLSDDALNAGWKLIVRRWLRINQAPEMPGKRLEELRRQVMESRPEQHATVRWNGWSARHDRARLWLHEDAGLQPCPELNWTADQALDLGHGLGTLQLEGEGDLPQLKLAVRARDGGERIACLAHGHHKSIKHLLQEAGVPPWLRASIPLLYQQDKIVALADWAMADDFRQSLAAQGLRLVWKPRDPALQHVAAMRLRSRS